MARSIPNFVWRWMKALNRSLTANFGAKTPEFVLVLTTTGRKSGQPRQTPLQYEEVEGNYLVASARGAQADWYRNLLADPNVTVQVKGRTFNGSAEPVTDPAKIADFFQLRLARRPRMMRLLLRAEGLPANFTRAQLEQFAAEKAVVVIKPDAI
jgi:deazaflavin-dependent oxidoreductase (nitroreductase family)